MFGASRKQTDFAHLGRRLLALVFVPSDDVTDVFANVIKDPAYRDTEITYDYI